MGRQRDTCSSIFVSQFIGTPFPHPPLPIYTIYQGRQQNESNSRRQTQYCLYLIVVQILTSRYDNIFKILKQHIYF